MANPLIKIRIEYECMNCKKRFFDKPSSVRKFCSRQCYNQYKNNLDLFHIIWLNRVDYNGRSTYRKLIKDNCFYCNSSSNLIVHHKDGNRKNNEENNLLTLCSSCHRKQHMTLENLQKMWIKIKKDKKTGRFIKNEIFTQKK